MAIVTASKRRRVLNRDQWVCQLCFRPIEQRSREPWGILGYPTVDHIIPRSQRARPWRRSRPERRLPRHPWLNSDLNLRAAHSKCNEVRGSKVLVVFDLTALYRNFAIACGDPEPISSPRKAITS